MSKKRNPEWPTGMWGAAQDFLNKEAAKEYSAQMVQHLKRGHKRSTMRYSVPEWQADMVEALKLDDPSTFLNLKYAYGARQSLRPLKKNPRVTRYKTVREMRDAGVPDMLHFGADRYGVGGQSVMLYPSGEQRPFLKHAGHFLSPSSDSTTLMRRKRIGEDEGEYAVHGFYDIWGRRKNPKVGRAKDRPTRPEAEKHLAAYRRKMEAAKAAMLDGTAKYYLSAVNNGIYLKVPGFGSVACYAGNRLTPEGIGYEVPHTVLAEAFNRLKAGWVKNNPKKRNPGWKVLPDGHRGNRDYGSGVTATIFANYEGPGWIHWPVVYGLTGGPRKGPQVGGISEAKAWADEKAGAKAILKKNPIPTTGQVTWKQYKCAQPDCGHEYSTSTNHYGAIYSKCPKCYWKGTSRQHRSICLEPVPAGMGVPPEWKKANPKKRNPSSHIGDIIRVRHTPSEHAPAGYAPFEDNYRVLDISNDPGRARRPIMVAATSSKHGEKGGVTWIAVDQIVKVIRRASNSKRKNA